MEGIMIVMLDVLVSCTGKDGQVLEVFQATLTEMATRYPSALRKAPGFDLHYEYVAGKDDLVLLHLPVLDSELDRLRPAVGPIWRRIAHAKGMLSEKAIQTMREMGELPAGSSS
jgi:hypothetical protein